MNNEKKNPFVSYEYTHLNTAEKILRVKRFSYFLYVVITLGICAYVSSWAIHFISAVFGG